MLTDYKINPKLTHKVLIKNGFRTINEDIYIKYLPLLYYRTKKDLIPTLYVQIAINMQNGYLGYGVVNDDYSAYSTYIQESFGDKIFNKKLNKMIEKHLESLRQKELLIKVK